MTVFPWAYIAQGHLLTGNQPYNGNDGIPTM